MNKQILGELIQIIPQPKNRTVTLSESLFDNITKSIPLATGVALIVTSILNDTEAKRDFSLCAV